MKPDSNFPIIIGVGQVVDRWTGEDITAAPHPVKIVKQAIDMALSDAGISDQASRVDCAAFIRTFSDSLRRPFDPFGKVKNFPHAVIDSTELSPDQIIYSSVGGEQPQALVAELCEKLHMGDIQLAVIAGGEVTGALKTAMKKNIKLEWGTDIQGDMQDRGAQTDFISKYEILNGLGLPPQTYAAMEQALRARLGMSKAEYRNYVGLMFSNLSKVSETNPYAQFPTFRTAKFLATPSKENYPIFEPYLKWHMAQDAVNQSAALILTTVGKARELGVSEDKWVYLHGYAKVTDALVSKRPDLSKSEAMKLTLERTLKSTGIAIQEVTHRDIYSCFPIVVQLAAEYLGLDPLNEQLTVTGGLPFFGGAGNNYSVHAIASLVEILRSDRGSYGMVLANGGFISKVAAGVYSTKAPEKWSPITSDDLQTVIDERPDIPTLNEDCDAVVEGYCIKHGRSGLEGGYVVARNDNGRVIANIKAEALATLNSLHAANDVVGKRISITHRNGQNFYETPLG